MAGRHLQFTKRQGARSRFRIMSYESSAHVVAIIPARGGSKGVPGKNLRLVGGRSLLARAIASCRAATTIAAVYVSTDDEVIAIAAREAGAQVITRPGDIAGDTATSESALLHALDVIAPRLGPQPAAPEVLVFVQCTSPFIDPADLDAAVDLVRRGEADAAFSGVETYDFLWRSPDQGLQNAPFVIGQNHDASVRPRRQDRRPDFRETGAFYVMAVDGFLTHRHRFFGRTVVVGVNELTAIEIDTPAELAIADAIAAVIEPPTPLTIEQIAIEQIAIDVVVTDFDGVHTPDTVYVGQDGQETVRVSRSDGMGVELLSASGRRLLIMSKETNPVVSARAAKLGVEVLQSVNNKADALQAWLCANNVSADRTAYLGNDVNDLGPMAVVGWPIAVADARDEVREAARLILTRRGGDGAVRELCDLVLAGDLSDAASERAESAERLPALVP